MILKIFWYASELSSAITNRPKCAALFGREFVLYRGTRGQVVALNNLYAHCSGALSDGWVEDDCIYCPYHGWKYQSDGTCIKIPADSPGTPISKQAHIDTYSVQEKYGWVWLFLGDLPEVERPPLPPPPEFGNLVWQVVYSEFKWNAPYTRVVENGIDISDDFSRQAVVIPSPVCCQVLELAKAWERKERCQLSWGSIAHVSTRGAIELGAVKR